LTVVQSQDKLNVIVLFDKKTMAFA